MENLAFYNETLRDRTTGKLYTITHRCRIIAPAGKISVKIEILGVPKSESIKIVRKRKVVSKHQSVKKEVDFWWSNL